MSAATSRPRAGALLVGSVPLGSAEEVLRACGEVLGPDVQALPDGETGDRSIWIVFQAFRVFHGHPQLETVQRPQPVDGVEQWAPTGLDNLWDFRVRPGAPLHFDDLKYASSARASYQTFRALRDEGVIPPGVRFQVSLPSAESILFFFRDPGQFAQIVPAYTEAMEREVDKLIQAVPEEDLLIQWDVCTEVLDVEGAVPWIPEVKPGPLDRYATTIARLSSRIPPAVPVGYHLCYADLGHQHILEPEDLSTAVEMANLTVASVNRPVDYFHLPVPRNRTDDLYFRPLRNLDIGNAQVFLGLVHYSDGVDGSRARLEAASRHLSGFGIATECGFGRRPPEQVSTLLRIHRELLDGRGPA
jgi:hypothetical protein